MKQAMILSLLDLVSILTVILFQLLLLRGVSDLIKLFRRAPYQWMEGVFFPVGTNQRYPLIRQISC